MTLELNGIVLAADTTVLSYTVHTNPYPLQISSTGSITVVVYSTSEVSCSSLTFTISKGGYDTDLTDNPNLITTSCPQHWSVTPDGSGRFIFTPTPGYDTISSDGLSFVFNSIAVNDQVGGTPLYIKETVTQNGQPQTNTTSFTLSKFPQNFALQYFNVNPTSVPPGGSVTVSWNGSGNSQNVTTYDYSLSYNTTTIPNLPNVDSYPVGNLLETTAFTLNITANGSAQYLQQLTVSVAQPEVGEFGIVGHPTQVPIGSSFRLYWQTVNADCCNLSLNKTPIDSSLPANMSESSGYPVTAPTTPGTYSYTLTAIGSDGSGPDRDLQVSVNAEILTFGIVGNPSEAGTNTTIKLYWSTQGATLCSLALNGTTVASNLPANVDPSQGYAFTLPAKTGTASFVLSTYYNQQSVGSSNPVSLSVIFQFDLVPIALPYEMLPFDMRVSPDGSLLGVAGGELVIISTANNQTIQTIDYIKNDDIMTYSTFNHDGTQAYGIVYPIVGSGSCSIESFDCSSGQRLSQSPAAYYMNMVRCSSASTEASTDMLVAATASEFGIPGRPFRLSSLCLLDPSNLSVAKSVSTIPPAYPYATLRFCSMAANPQGDQVLICAFANDSTGLYSYQLSSDTFPASPLFTELAPTVVVFSTDGSRYFIANTTDPEISVVDTSQNQVIGKITLPAPLSNTIPLVYAVQSPMVAAPDGINFFALLNNQTIAWIKLDSMKVVLCSPVPSGVFAIATVKNSTGLYLYMLADGLGMCEVPDLA